MVLLDRRGRATWWNAALRQALPGQPRMLAPLGELLQALGADDKTLAQVQRALAGSNSLQAEINGHDRERRSVTLGLDLQPIQQPLPGFIAVLVDLSEVVAQRNKTQALLAALPSGVMLRSAQGRVIDCNPAAETMLQLSRAQILGTLPTPDGWQALHPDLAPMAADEHPGRQVLRSGQAVHGATMGVMGAGGELRWLLADADLMRDADGRILGAVACFTDVTEQRKQQTVLQHTVEAAGLGTWRWSIDSGRMTYNERLLTMLGYCRGDVEESMSAWSALVHADDRLHWQAAMRAHLADPAMPCRTELRVRRPDGEWAAVLSCGIVIERDAQGRALSMAGINIDMTEQRQMQAMLRHAARTDGLTQLPNRAAVFDQVQQVIDRAVAGGHHDYAVLFMDCDRFKQVNDTMGHAAGDELLRQIAQRLRAVLRAGDVVGVAAGLGAGRTAGHTAGRIGGDEFVVVLDGVHGRDGACAVARRLIEELSSPYVIAGTLVHSTISIGIVTSEHPARDAATVMRDADTAMYEAKRLGRGRFVVFDPSMHERVARGVAIEADLRQALDRQELFVVYQPVVELHKPGPGGVEALVRWRHPTRGLVPPLQFIGIAEESGLIVELGLFVLETACRQFTAWQRALGSLAPSSLAVNLSPMQLRSAGLVDAVRRCLADNGMPPEALQLEVTESLAAQDDAARTKLREIKALGVRIALDDFGTGYSSLACLHQLPVDTVKIDRSFVMHAEQSDYHRVLIEATIRVAKTLGMVTVAEGIETEGQSTLMRRLHCDRGQGFLYSRPLESDALTSWLASREPAAREAA